MRATSRMIGIQCDRQVASCGHRGIVGSEEHGGMSRRIAGGRLAMVDRWNVKRLPRAVSGGQSGNMYRKECSDCRHRMLTGFRRRFWSA